METFTGLIKVGHCLKHYSSHEINCINETKNKDVGTGQTLKIIFDILQYFVETYWESWIYKDYPDDYCAEMKEVPASAIGSLQGANYVNIGKEMANNFLILLRKLLLDC